MDGVRVTRRRTSSRGAPLLINVKATQHHPGEHPGPPAARAGLETKPTARASSVQIEGGSKKGSRLRPGSPADAEQASAFEGNTATDTQGGAAPQPRLHDLRTTEWLLGAEPHQYVVQLIGAWQPQELEEFLRQEGIDVVIPTDAGAGLRLGHRCPPELTTPNDEGLVE